MGDWFIGMTPHEIYLALTTGPGSEKVDAAQRAAKILWEDESERAELIRRQGELIRSGWQGSASDGAFGAAQPLAASALNRVDELARAEDLLDRQSGSFNRAKNEVRPVPAEPPGIDLTDPMVVFSDYEKQIVSYQADAHHNMEVFRGYDNASNYNETNIPARYSTVNGSGGSISVTADGARPSDTGDYIEVRDQPRTGGESGPYSGPGNPGRSPVSGPPAGGPPVSGPVPNPSLPQQTTPSTYVPPAVTPPSTYPPNPYQPAPGGPGNPGPGVPVGGFLGGSSGGAPGGRSGYGPGGGYGPRGGGYSPGNPGPGARPPLPGPGPATGAIAAEEAAARRAAATAAVRGAGPGGMAGAPIGAGRGRGDEDEEHQRKVLIETDGEDIFGSDVLTAPQVIGDDEYEDD